MYLLIDAYRLRSPEMLIEAGLLEPLPVWDDVLGGPAWVVTPEGVDALRDAAF